MTKTSPTAKRIHIVRHAQAEHNVASDYTSASPLCKRGPVGKRGPVRDAPLTDLGREQCVALHKQSVEGVQRTAELLVSSPLRRTMETTLKSFPQLRKRLEGQGRPIVLLDILQEVSDLPCDTALYPPSTLAASNDGMFAQIDFSSLSPEYASKKGLYAPSEAPTRAREVRRWLRDRPEGEIVVVAHGDIIRFIVGHYNAAGETYGAWENTETRVYTFASTSDAEASLVEIDKELKNASMTDAPTSSEM